MIIPFAKEQGFDFSIEDIKEFEQSIVEKLDEEQLKDISAGGGLGATICAMFGLGIGGWADAGTGFCIIIGAGFGSGRCAGSGSGYFKL